MKTVNNVTISLGKPVTAPVLIPVTHKATPSCINEPFMAGGEIFRVTCVSFGTPHGGVIVDDVDSIDLPHIGYLLGTHALFPKGASIVFIEVLDEDNIKARLWQRDEGEVAFTPEAACVALTVAVIMQKIIQDAYVSMGGNLFHVEWSFKDENVFLTGSLKHGDGSSKDIAGLTAQTWGRSFGKWKMENGDGSSKPRGGQREVTR